MDLDQIKAFFSQPGFLKYFGELGAGLFGVGTIIKGLRYGYCCHRARNAYNSLKKDIEYATRPLPNGSRMNEIIARQSLMEASMDVADKLATFCMNSRGARKRTNWLMLVRIGQAYIQDVGDLMGRVQLGGGPTTIINTIYGPVIDHLRDRYENFKKQEKR